MCRRKTRNILTEIQPGASSQVVQYIGNQNVSFQKLKVKKILIKIPDTVLSPSVLTVSLSNFADSDDVTQLNDGVNRKYTFALPLPADTSCGYVSFYNNEDEWDFHASEHGRPPMLENQLRISLRINNQSFIVEEPIFIEWCVEEAR
jgi:hypothetical protein